MLDHPPGSYTSAGRVPPRPLAERFWEKVDRRGPDECWPWLGAITNWGYGTIRVLKVARAHRVAYELVVGPIPAGMELDHLCRNRRCVNPAHLEPVTGRVNTLRGDSVSARHARQTHCRAGHEFTPENTAWSARGEAGRSSRRCRACNRVAVRALAQRKRARSEGEG